LGELSGGQRQLVSIAQTLVCRPRIVQMDEPTSALDLYRQFEVLELLQEYARSSGAVVLLALHDLNQVLRYCETALALRNGTLEAVGRTQSILDSALLRRLYGVEARFETCSRGFPIMVVDGIEAAA
ncbi:MAG: ATP-binding cassette domain-containing protein, partial [Rhodobacterales bacterium]